MVLGVPLAVLAPATGPYDDPKAWALPILVALTGLGWVATAGRRAPRAAAPDRGSFALSLGVVAFLAWSAVAALASVAPIQSILGNFGRGLGMLTVGGAGLLFFLIRSEHRTLGEVRSLVDAALLGSMPIVVLGLAQAAGWDPLPKAWDPAVQTLTVRSTFGTHVFLGTYLVVLVPLTAARLVWAGAGRVEAGRWARANRAHVLRGLVAALWVAGAVVLVGLAPPWPILWWALVPWGVLGAVAWTFAARHVDDVPDTRLSVLILAGLLSGQLMVVVLSRGRGAFVGTVVGLGVTGFAFLVRRRAWRLVAVSGVAAAALVAFLVLLNWPGSPVAPLRGVRLLSRLGDITNVKRGTPGWVRIQLWKGIAEGWRRQLGGDEVIAGHSPRLRSLVGYGPETQLIVLEPLTSSFAGRLVASGEGWQARYVFDRSHNALLDLVVTEGLIGASLWVLVVSGVVVLGFARLRAGAGLGEITLRAGALGAVVGHVADGQVGMETPMALALFWLAAALATADPWASPSAASSPPSASRRRWWKVAVVGAVLVAALVAWTATRWLLASVAYAEGVRSGIAGRLSDAYLAFQRSVALAPWLPLPAESAAYTALRLATSESEPTRRADLLREAEALLARARAYAIGGAGSWALSGQIAFAEARAGQPSQLATSRDAFAAALRLRPNDPRLLAQSAWVWLESGDLPRAKQAAEAALAREPREWVAWAVLARASRALGDAAVAARATDRARDLAPREARALVDALLR